MKSSINFNFLRDKRVQRLWILLVIAWACIRAIVIRDVFSSYGVNPWIYFAVDLFSGIPYAIYSARFVVNFLDKDWDKSRWNAAMTAMYFYIPDVYVLAASKNAPKSLVIGFLISVLIFSIFALVGIRKNIKDKKVAN